MNSMCKWLGVMFGVLWLLMADMATAGEYELVIGKGRELCEVCRQNIERMTAHPACERAYSADLGLGAPQWKPFELQKNFGTMKQVMKYLRTGNEFAKDEYMMGEEQYEAQLREAVAKGLLKWVSVAKIDIDNDGLPDLVLRLRGGVCPRRYQGYNLAYDTPIVVLKGDRSGLDRGKSDLLSQNPYRSPDYLGDRNYQIYDVFTYRGKTYFDRWNDTAAEDERQRFTLTIYEIQDGKVTLDCQFKELASTEGATP
jgi:hypothetical protein